MDYYCFYMSNKTTTFRHMISRPHINLYQCCKFQGMDIFSAVLEMTKQTELMRFVLERSLTSYDPEADARPELFHWWSKDG